MVKLTKEIIMIMNRLQETIEGTPFKINRFEVDESGDGAEIITLDIRREK